MLFIIVKLLRNFLGCSNILIIIVITIKFIFNSISILIRFEWMKFYNYNKFENLLLLEISIIRISSMGIGQMNGLQWENY